MVTGATCIDCVRPGYPVYLQLLAIVVFTTRNQASEVYCHGVGITCNSDIAGPWKWGNRVPPRKDSETECSRTKGSAGMRECAERDTCRCLLVSVFAHVGVCLCRCLLVSVFARVSVCSCRCLLVSVFARGGKFLYITRATAHCRSVRNNLFMPSPCPCLLVLVLISVLASVLVSILVSILVSVLDPVLVSVLNSVLVSVLSSSSSTARLPPCCSARLLPARRHALQLTRRHALPLARRHALPLTRRRAVPPARRYLEPCRTLPLHLQHTIRNRTARRKR